uniref:HTH_48 domain-containing protein n=1 Tax=Meloidogyne hapla TaxID=6305 RepID=A0A1I8BTA5_MELHA
MATFGNLMTKIDFAWHLSLGLSQTTVNQIATFLGVSPLLLANKIKNCSNFEEWEENKKYEKMEFEGFLNQENEQIGRMKNDIIMDNGDNVDYF